MTILDNLPPTYEPKRFETDIRQFWEQGGYFHAEPGAKPKSAPAYTIVIPPPNVTGALHGGHALNNTLQDILIRWHRMRGFNTLWMPGTDHAGIATQAVVERTIFEKEHKSRHDLGREEMVRRIWEWKEAYGNRIINQLKLMGCSCDWDRTRFTLDDMCARAVRHTFFKLFKDGLIVRGKRLVNWDTHLQTAVADDEVYHESTKGHFYHFKYPVKNPKPGEPEFVHIATTRPETMLGDTAVAVHPDPAGAMDAVEADLKQQLAEAAEKDRPAIQAQLDDIAERRRTVLPLLIQLRDMALDGRKLILPLVDREIPLIADVWAKPELGSGCVKITPAHDANDYEVGQRHKLAMINVMTSDGKVAKLEDIHNEKARKYEGLRFNTDARKAVVADLEALGLVEKIEDRLIEIGHSDRSKTPIEPFLSDQWFVRMGDLSEQEVQQIQSEHMRAYIQSHGPTEPRRSEPRPNEPRPNEPRPNEPRPNEPRPSGSGAPATTTYPGLAQMTMDAVAEEPLGTPEARRDSGKVYFFPGRYRKTYLDWLGEKRDWCISRQLWWGHRIPVWRGSQVEGSSEGEKRTAKTHEWLQAGRIAVCYGPAHSTSERPAPGSPPFDRGRMVISREIYICVKDAQDKEVFDHLRNWGFVEDPDVLDTWFSSALWPHSTMGWPEGTAELQRYYPGSVLSTAREIITLWVARMVLTGLYNLGKVPFHDVYIHAVIQDGQGRPFKKTLGNGFDPVDIIEAYGADALRFTMASLTTETQDIRMPMKKVKLEDGRELQSSERFELGRNFCNKLWNAARFAFMNLGGDGGEETGRMPVPHQTDRLEAGPTQDKDDRQDAGLTRATGKMPVPHKNDRLEAGATLRTLDIKSLPIEDRWILSQTSRAVAEVQQALLDFQFSRAITLARDFFWDALCDWYLELVKPRIGVGPASSRSGAEEQPEEATGKMPVPHKNDRQDAGPTQEEEHRRDAGATQEHGATQKHGATRKHGATQVDGATKVDDRRQAAEARQVLAFVLDQSLRLLHPFVPYITEALWKFLNQIAPKRGLPGVAGVGELDCGEALIHAKYAPVDGYPSLAAPEVDAVFADLQTATRAVRDIRQNRNVPPKQTVDVAIKVPAERVKSLQAEAHVIQKLANVGQLTIGAEIERPANAATLVIGDMQIFVANVIDAAAERGRLEKELANIDKQIAGITGKLANEKFVSGAKPEVVARERERLAEFQAKRETVVQAMAELA